MGSKHNLNGRCAIVTGAAGGIGLSFCKELASRGCNVVMVDLVEERLATASTTLKELYPDVKTHLLAADLTASDIIDLLENFLLKENIHPEILINNAGIFAFSPAVDIPGKKIDCFIDLHVRAVTNLSRWMATRSAAKGKGWILNMSSMSCWMPMPGLSMYAATKAYIRVFTRSLHYEMKDSGVRVMAACPGGIATDLFGLPDNLKRLAVAIGAISTPEKFTKKAVSKLLKGRKQYINGWLNRVSIFFVGITPDWIRMLIKHKMLDKGIRR